jgi:hypothetical protein
MREKQAILSLIMAGRRQTQSIDTQIIRRIRAHGSGWVFTPGDFLDLGSRTAVDNALCRHTASGRIRRLSRGLYDNPVRHPRLGLLHPSTDAVARAIAGRDRVRLQPAGAHAAHLLGLSDQVPLRTVFLTDGPSKRVVLGRQEIILRKTTPRGMATAGRVSGLVIQALRHLGRAQVNDAVLAHLRGRLSDVERKQLLADARHAPGWVAGILRGLAGEGEDRL